MLFEPGKCQPREELALTGSQPPGRVAVCSGHWTAGPRAFALSSNGGLAGAVKGGLSRCLCPSQLPGLLVGQAPEEGQSSKPCALPAPTAT